MIEYVGVGNLAVNAESRIPVLEVCDVIIRQTFRLSAVESLFREGTGSEKKVADQFGITHLSGLSNAVGEIW